MPGEAHAELLSELAGQLVSDGQLDDATCLARRVVRAASRDARWASACEDFVVRFQARVRARTAESRDGWVYKCVRGV